MVTNFRRNCEDTSVNKVKVFKLSSKYINIVYDKINDFQ